ncbi:hypothetical protein BJV74DRAFT_889798 [Russula compacta]|nr:hypothetical protein BJV74DRAFT_889798 [Russula compacta]
MSKAELLKNSRINKQYRRLRIDYKVLQSDRRTAQNKGRCSKKSLSGKEKEIGYAGARFCFAYEPWVEHLTLKIEPSINLDPLSPDHYKTSHTAEHAIAAEVYASITPELQAAWRMNHAGSPSLTLTAGPESNSLVKSSHPTLAQELEQLLLNPMKPDKKYPLFPSLLYPSKDCTSPLLFEVEVLAMFLRIILHRKSAIDGSGLGWHPNKALLWGVMETTLGMITLAATVLTFVYGPDQTFTQKTKGESKIAWKMHFLQYKQTILHFPSSYHKHLLAFYNVHIFRESLISVPESLELTETALNDIDNIL